MSWFSFYMNIAGLFTQIVTCHLYQAFHFAVQAEIEMNSGPLSHRILDNCLSRTSFFTYAGVFYVPAIIVQASSRQLEAQNHRFVFSIFFFCCCCQKLHGTGAEPGTGTISPSEVSMSRMMEADVQLCERASVPFQRLRSSPLSFRDAAHAVSCPLLFSHSYPL